jgi:hypothetical protein
MTRDRRRVGALRPPSRALEPFVAGVSPGAGGAPQRLLLREPQRGRAWREPGGGALRYSEYSPLKRFVVRLFVRLAGGDGETSRDHEYTDWRAVAQFADRFAEPLSATA